MKMRNERLLPKYSPLLLRMLRAIWLVFLPSACSLSGSAVTDLRMPMGVEVLMDGGVHIHDVLVHTEDNPRVRLENVVRRQSRGFGGFAGSRLRCNSQRGA